VVRNTYLKGRWRTARETTLPDDLPASAADLDLQLDERARLAAVTAALAELPEGQRSALLLRVDHELAYDDIAATLGISLSAAKVRVHRARLRLAQLCREEEGVSHDR
jgi:RNA polymerase sigma-70 factor (ECF subfamily)